jgi:multidrug efflux pump subunit AcrA (membrane-fusion protein)
VKRGRIALIGVPLILAGGGAALGLGGGNAVPLAAVRVSEWIDWHEVRGEVKALRSLTLVVPPRAGDLQILKIVAGGTAVKEGEVLVEFDPTKRKRTLEEQQAALKQADAEVERSRADARLKDEESRTRLMRAAYDVERARLEASKGEVIAALEGQKRKLDLADKEGGLQALRKQIEAERAARAAEIEGYVQKRRTAELDVKESEGVLAVMALKAPVDGNVTILSNPRSRGWFGSGGAEWKVGDRPWAGAPMAELPDLSTLRIISRVDEADRGRLAVGQTARMRIDAVPDKQFDAKVADISPLAKIDFQAGWPPPKNFDITFELTEIDNRLRPGMSGTVRVAVGQTKDALIVPARACFTKSGRTVTYVKKFWSFEERPIEVSRRSKTEVVVASGLGANDKIALADPTLPPEERGR